MTLSPLPPQDGRLKWISRPNQPTEKKAKTKKKANMKTKKRKGARAQACIWTHHIDAHVHSTMHRAGVQVPYAAPTPG